MPRIPRNERVDPRFPERWSPRSYAPRPVPALDLAALFEAARWAPSASNEQPWLFVYADAEPGLSALRGVVNDTNRQWAGRAPVLVLAFARRHNQGNGKPNRWAAFDTGAAWMSLALQARALGLACHAMGGFSVEEAHRVTGLPAEEYEALCAIAVGYAAPVEELPEAFRSREVPNDRKDPAEVARRLP